MNTLTELTKECLLLGRANMRKVFEILRQIEGTSSRNEKKAILEKNKDNELLKKFFFYALNNRLVFGIGEKSIKRVAPKKISTTSSISQNSLFGGNKQIPYTNIFDLLDELVKHPFGSQQDVDAVNNLLQNCADEEYYWYTKLILKDLKIGCTVKTVNEVMDNYIPHFEVMLAHPYNKHADKIKGNFQIQRKIDGFRFITILYPDMTTRFFTRNGLELFEFPQIEREFHAFIVPPYPVVYDGELICKDTFNDTQKLIMKQGPKTGLVYHIFDKLPLSEFEAGQSNLNLFDRFDSFFVPDDLRYIVKEEELYRGNDLEQVTKWFNYAKSQGWEGIMLKLNGPYVRKRTTDMLKVKEFDTLDLRVIRVNPGTGKHEGRLGSVTVDFEGNEVDVGSGFDDYSRETFWNNPNLILDKIIEVQYFEVTQNKDGKPSLRFPIYKRIRIDK